MKLLREKHFYANLYVSLLDVSKLRNSPIPVKVMVFRCSGLPLLVNDTKRQKMLFVPLLEVSVVMENDWVFLSVLPIVSMIFKPFPFYL